VSTPANFFRVSFETSSARTTDTDASLNASADWPSERVIYELRTRGLVLRQLSLKNGMHSRSLYEALRKPWARGERIIARALKMKPEQIWPSRYARRRRGKS